MANINPWINAEKAFFEQNSIYDSIDKWSPHAQNFYKMVLFIKDRIDLIYEIGCGSGVYFHILKQYFKDMQYCGYDISPIAIEVAKKWSKNDSFYIADYQNSEIKNKNSLLVMNGVIEALDNPEEALDNILSKKAKFVFLQRMLLTEKDTYSTQHNKSYSITINESRLNRNVFREICDKYNYNVDYIFDLNTYNRPYDDINYYDIFLSLK